MKEILLKASHHIKTISRVAYSFETKKQANLLLVPFYVNVKCHVNVFNFLDKTSSFQCLL